MEILCLLIREASNSITPTSSRLFSASLFSSVCLSWGGEKYSLTRYTKWTDQTFPLLFRTRIRVDTYIHMHSDRDLPSIIYKFTCVRRKEWDSIISRRKQCQEEKLVIKIKPAIICGWKERQKFSPVKFNMFANDAA